MRILLCLTLALAVFAANAEPRVLMKTSIGDVVLELDRENAPATVSNFIGYVERGDYDGTIFHRVIPGFMIQGGGHNPDMTMRPERQTIRNEADNGLKNVTGTIAMARMSGIDSAARQFFINVADNTHLDHKPTSCTREEVAEVKAARKQGRAKPLTCDGYGYTVFGRVIRGMDVIREMEIRETATRGGHRNVPVEPIVIESMSVIDDEAATAP